MQSFFRFVEAVFQFRRKQLGGTVARLASMPNADASRMLRELAIDPARRPQTLDLAEWEAMYRAVNLRFGR